jgi:RNA polymerase sigma factor (sigma-70 family)
MNDPRPLLIEYSRHGSEESFRELVRRYTNLVYSVALRQSGCDHHSAEDLVQKVFADLAAQLREGRGPLASEPVQLGGWLHHHTCLVAANQRRANQRRRARDHEAAQMQISGSSSETQDAWADLEPILDPAMNALSPSDRDALVLRFLERHPLRDLGHLLGIGEDAAQKRVARALERLRAELLRRGVTVSAVLLATLMDDRTTTAAPIGLDERVARQVTDSLRQVADIHSASTATASLMGSLAAWWAKWPGSALATLGVGVVAVALLVGAKVAWSSRRATEPPAPSLAARSEAERLHPTDPGTGQSRISPGAGSAESTAATPAVLRLTLVSAKDGRPIPNASVVVTAMQRERSATSNFRTDASGMAELRYPGTSDRLVAVTRTEQHADLFLTWQAGDEAVIPESYEARLEDGVAIAGNVLSEAGDPIFNARVLFHAEVDGDRLSPVAQFAFQMIPATTDVTGRWSIPGVPAWLLDRLRGSAALTDGELSTSRSVDGDPRLRAQLLDGTFRFVLANGQTLAGEVLDPTGRRVAGAAVRILSAPTFVGGRTTTTSAEGTFAFGNCAPGTNLVTAQADGWAPRTLVAVAGVASEPVRIILAPARSLRLRVTGPTGAPAQGVSVRLDSVSPDLSRRATDPSITRAEFAARTDVDGRVTWDSAPDEDLTLVIGEWGDWEVQRLVLRPTDEEHTVRLSLAPVTSGTASSQSQPRATGTSLSFEVREPDGTPAGHAEVVVVDRRQSPGLLAPDGIGALLRDGMARAGGDGTVSMPSEMVSGSEWVVLAHHQAGMALVLASEVVSSRLVTLRAWSRIEGRLRDRTRPRPGVTLDLEGDFNAPDGLQPMLERFRTTTEEDGRFEFPRVPPGRLRLAIHDKAQPASMSDGDSLDLPLETEPGKTLSLEIGAEHRPVRLRLAEPAILVLLESVGADGKGGAAGRSSRVMGEGGGPRVTLGQTEKGVWSTRSAPPGRYRLAVLPGEVMTPATARELKFVGEIVVPVSPTGEVFDAGEFGIQAAGAE